MVVWLELDLFFLSLCVCACTVCKHLQIRPFPYLMLLLE